MDSNFCRRMHIRVEDRSKQQPLPRFELAQAYVFGGFALLHAFAAWAKVVCIILRVYNITFAQDDVLSHRKDPLRNFQNSTGVINWTTSAPQKLATNCNCSDWSRDRDQQCIWNFPALLFCDYIAKTATLNCTSLTYHPEAKAGPKIDTELCVVDKAVCLNPS